MARFRRNPAFDTEIRHEPTFRAGIASEARPAQRFANAFAVAIGAGWMPQKGGTPETVTLVQDADGVRLVNTDHGGHLMEWGSVNNPPHAPLRRGARAAGLRLAEDPR